MAAVRSVDSACEVALRRELWARGWRYRLHVRRAAGALLPGRPDLVFVSQRVIVFVDGDFWHGRTLTERGRRALSAQFRHEKRKWWVAKIAGNVKRDRTRDADLRAAGWHVIRLWESDVNRSPRAAASRVERALKKRTR